jgi:signal transduction histidine kinase/ligand-binding sensor domain-containing protein
MLLMKSKAGHLPLLSIASLAFLVSFLALVQTPVDAADGSSWCAVHCLPGGFPDRTPTSFPCTDTVAILQEPRARFERISTTDGLSSFRVRPILQDRQGFMWLGTHGGGLNKYDGYQFTVYRHDPDDPNTLSHDVVHALYEDQDGHLWVGTESGLDRLARRHEQTPPTFVRFLEGQGPVFSIYEDSRGILWVGAMDGLVGLDRTVGTIQHTFHHSPDASDDPGALSGYAVRAMQEDQKGRLWIGTSGGLDQLDLSSGRSTGTLTHYRHNPDDPSSLSAGSVYAIHRDRQGALWIGTYGGGLDRLDLNESAGSNHAPERFTHYSHVADDPCSLGDDRVWSILEDSVGTLWIGTFNGLDQLGPSDVPGPDGSQDCFRHHQHDPADPYSVSGDLAWSLYEDRSGVVWVGTSGGGLSKYNRKTNQFARFTRVLSDGQVTAVHEDRNGVLWIGTASGGLNRLDRQAGNLTVYHHDPADPASLSSDAVHAIFEDRAGVLWVGAGGWLERFNPQIGTFAHHRRVDPAVEELFEDRSGNLWIGTANGLYRLDRTRETLVSYHPQADDPNSLSHPDIQVIQEDQEGVLWIGTSAGGINLWEPGNEQFVHYRNDPGDPDSLSRDGVVSIYIDPTGVVWIGTVGGGLNRFDRATQTFGHYRENDGLSGDSVGCILPDSAGHLWLRTVTGLSRFDPHTETFRNYDERDGLLTGGITPLACFQSESGEMFYGSTEGIYAFYPEQIRDNPHIPPVVVTALDLFNETVRRDLFPDEHIQLAYGENFVSFEFAALDYTMPEKNEYAYMMEGLDRDWVYAGTRRHADYPNLQPGDYVFRVRGSNNDGVWNEEGAAAHVTITPPFWEMWWFRGLIALVLIGGGIAGYRLRVRNIEARSRELEREVEERTTALRREIDQRLQAEEALRERELEQAVAAERSRLARDLHDAVTQTLFSASLIAEALPGSWERDREEGQRLLKELRQLSRGALAEMRTLLLELRPASLVEAKLGDLLHQLAEAGTGREGLPISVTVAGERRLPPDVHVAMYRIAQEGLNNAIKHSRATHAQVHLRYLYPVGEEDGEGGVELRIHDDGRGFDPGDVSADHLGLDIMRERADAIGARLEITSEPGRGTQILVEWKEQA